MNYSLHRLRLIFNSTLTINLMLIRIILVQVLYVRLFVTNGWMGHITWMDGLDKDSSNVGHRQHAILKYFTYKTQFS